MLCNSKLCGSRKPTLRCCSCSTMSSSWPRLSSISVWRFSLLLHTKRKRDENESSARQRSFQIWVFMVVAWCCHENEIERGRKPSAADQVSFRGFNVSINFNFKSSMLLISICVSYNFKLVWCLWGISQKTHSSWSNKRGKMSFSAHYTVYVYTVFTSSIWGDREKDDLRVYTGRKWGISGGQRSGLIEVWAGLGSTGCQ